MNNKFGTIPPDILAISLYDPEWREDFPYTLKMALNDITDEEILEAKYEVFNDSYTPILKSFTAWTKSNIIFLVVTPYADYLIANGRNST